MDYKATFALLLIFSASCYAAIRDGSRSRSVAFSYGSGSRSAAPYHGLLDPDLDPYLDLDSDPAADPAADPGPSRCLQKATF